MAETTIKKVNLSSAPHGDMGQTYLASGKHVAMRMWVKEQSDDSKPATTRDYETVGFALKGRAELHLEGQKIMLEPGDSWLVPKGASHTYKILETFSALEATAPPAHAHGRDE